VLRPARTSRALQARAEPLPEQRGGTRVVVAPSGRDDGGHLGRGQFGRGALLAAVDVELAQGIAERDQARAGGVISDVQISVNAHGITPDASNIGTFASQDDGVYTINGLAPGTYKVEANNLWASGYVVKWYDNELTMDNAEEIVLGAAETRGGINFTLEQEGILSGHIYVAGTGATTPIANACVDIYTDPCHQGHLRGTQTDADGYYEIGGYAPGTSVYIMVNGTCGGENYVTQWYPGPYDCNLALPAAIGDTVDFELSPGGSIAGVAEDSGGDPIVNLHIYATEYDTGVWMSGANTDEDGSYTLLGLPTGSYRVQTCASCSGLPFVDEQYDNTYSWENAARVGVTAPGATAPINFTLDAGNTISGKISGLAAGDGPAGFSGSVALSGAVGRGTPNMVRPPADAAEACASPAADPGAFGYSSAMRSSK